MKRKIEFIAIEDSRDNRDGEAGWQIFVDGELIIAIDNDETDIADHSLDELWKALDIELVFDFD